MRIAIVAREIVAMTGMAAIVLEHTRRFATHGAEVHLFAERLDVARIREAGGVPHALPTFPVGRHFKRRVFAWSAARAVRRAHCDLVWGQGDILDQDVLSMHNCVHAAHEAVHGRPLSARSSVGALHARILREHRFTRMIANSALMKDDVVRRFGVPEGDVSAIHPGYDPRRFRPQDRAALGAPLRRELGLAESTVLIGLVTSGDFAKRGLDRLLEAVRLVSAPVRERTRLVVVGRDTRWRPRADLARVAEGATFLPPAPEVERVYHALDVLVHPALFEEFGMTVQEAMACGVPVVTSARVGASELLQRVAPERVLEAPEPHAIARALEPLVLDPSERALASTASLEACADSSWDANFRATRRVLDLARARSASAV